MIPFSLTVDVGQGGLDYATDRLLNHWSPDYKIVSALPLIGSDCDWSNVPYSLQIEMGRITAEQVRQNLIQTGPRWGVHVKKAYPIPDIDPRVCEAIEWAAYDQGELPL